MSYRSKMNGDLVLSIQSLKNTKIKSSRNAMLNSRKKERNKRRPHGRIIGLCEVFSQIMSHRTVFCSARFVHASTTSLEDRPAMLVNRSTYHDKASSSKRKDRSAQSSTSACKDSNNEVVIPPSISSRVHFEDDVPWRQFTPNQQVQIQDNYSVSLSIDTVTLYSARPPELFFVDNYIDYIVFFGRSSSKKASVDDDLTDDVFTSLWIDGFEKVTLIRKPAIIELLRKYSKKMIDFTRKTTGLRVVTSTEIFDLFHVLFLQMNSQVYTSEHHAVLSEFGFDTIATRRRIREKLFQFDSSLFVDETYEVPRLPLVLHDCVRPSNTNKFFVHILLSMGNFVTEYDLWDTSNVRGAFVNAGLLRSDACVEEVKEDMQSLAHRYVSEQLFFLPNGNNQFDHYLEAAYETFMEIYRTGNLPQYVIPAFLHTTLAKQIESTCSELRKSVRMNMIIALIEFLPNLPSLEVLTGASLSNPLPEDLISYTHLPDQSPESKFEQSHAFNYLKEVVDAYKTCSIGDRNNWLLHGSPGTGKTHMALLIAAYAIGQGLDVMSMALLCERAIFLGGMHYHKALKMVSFGRKTDIHSRADSCIRRLKRDPPHLMLLRSLDIIFFDEISQTSAEDIAVLDIVLRYVRSTEAYMGGILLIGAMDIEQLGCINGTPFLMSANIVTSYEIIDMQHYVRCGGCHFAQTINNICRLDVISPDDEATFIDLISTHCQFVKSFDDPNVPLEAMRVLGSNKGVANAEVQFVQNLIVRNVNVVTVSSIDRQKSRSSLSNYQSAEPKIVQRLNSSHEIREPQNIYFYAGAVMEFTFNKPGLWSQGQLYSGFWIHGYNYNREWVQEAISLVVS